VKVGVSGEGGGVERGHCHTNLETRWASQCVYTAERKELKKLYGGEPTEGGEGVSRSKQAKTGQGEAMFD